MSEAVENVVRIRRSRIEADQIVSEFERSGLSRRAFCAQHDLSVATLDKYRYRRRLKRQQTPSLPVTNRILPIELVGNIESSCSSVENSRRALCVELANGRRIEVSHGFDAATLQQLIVVLEKV